MEPDIINPIATVRIRGESVEVRELTWKDHLRLIKELTATVLELLQKAQTGGGGTEFSLKADEIVEALVKQEDLAAWVMARSTGKPKEWIDELSAGAAMDILLAAAKLNLTPEVLASGKALAEHMRGVFGLKSLSLEPSTALSSKATASKTSTP